MNDIDYCPVSETHPSLVALARHGFHWFLYADGDNRCYRLILMKDGVSVDHAIDHRDFVMCRKPEQVNELVLDAFESMRKAYLHDFPS
jgi:hypothetical protein